MSLRNEPSHEETEEGFDGIVAGSVRQESLGTSGDGPADHDGWDPHVGAEFLADKTAGKFCCEETDEEDLLMLDSLALDRDLQ